MSTETRDAPEKWAALHFGAADLGDERRTNRAVQLAAQMLRRPAGSIPQQSGTWAATKASYRLFNEEEVTFEALGRAHWALTRAEAGKRQVVLMIEDTTELDYTPHPSAEDLGPIGNGGGQGMLLHNTLALDPNGVGEVLGLAHQILFLRQPVPPDETVTQRKHRDRESRIWGQSVEAVGSPPAGSQWVHVCDRGADNFEMLEACRKTQVDFVIRMAQNRRCVAGHDPNEAQPTHLVEWVRTLPAVGEKTLHLRRRRKRSPRETQLSIAYSAMTLLPPWLDRDASPCPGWVVRVWEPDTPSGEDPIEWILLTSVPVESLEDAMTISHWYSLRWLVEEYHMCLKTGCKVEERQLGKRARLEPCIAILGIVAVQLLQIKLTARNKPNAPASACASPLHVQLLAAYWKKPLEAMTAHDFWRNVARLGGFLARKGDGDPGWQTLWKGWLRLDAMAEGAALLQGTQKCG